MQTKQQAQEALRKQRPSSIPHHEEGVALPSQPGKAAMPPAPEFKETSRTVVLDYPVMFAGITYTQLSVRRLKAKDFRQLDQIAEGGNAAAIAMSALICGVDEAVIDELDATDYLKVQEVIADFFPSALVGRLQAKGLGSSPT